MKQEVVIGHNLSLDSSNQDNFIVNLYGKKSNGESAKPQKSLVITSFN
ncbi:hypothetical protein ACFQ5E_00290 [Oceanobacillus sojae]